MTSAVPRERRVKSPAPTEAKPSRPAKSGRGRPRAQEHRKVADDILAAAKRCLEKKGVSEVSLREIAAEAGTDQATISYYYGSRDNLLLEIVDESIDEVLQGLDELRARIVASPDAATLTFFEYLQSFILGHAPAAKIFVSELIHADSTVGKFYDERWSSMTTRALGAIIKTLMDSGIYRRDIDPEQIAFLFKGLVIYTLLKPQLNEASFLFGNFDKAGWVGLVTKIMDSYLRSPPGADSGRHVVTTTK